VVSNILAEAKKLIAAGNKTDGGFKLLQAYRGLPKNKHLIKFLSEEGIKVLLQKTEGEYMQDNSRRMHIVDEDLYFVIDEKNNQIDLTDKGVEYMSQGNQDSNFFVLEDIGTLIAELEAQNLTKEEEFAKKEELFREYAVKSERIHTLSQLLKAYTSSKKMMNM
jgi:preprotein translocase subunit SecA